MPGEVNHKKGLSCEITFLPLGSACLLSMSFTIFSDPETHEISVSDRTSGNRVVFSNLPARPRLIGDDFVSSSCGQSRGIWQADINHSIFAKPIW
jgi:hypothetical protein